MAAGNYRTEHTEKVLCALIAAGADVNKADKDGWDARVGGGSQSRTRR
jgi:hypothetical protein